MRKDANLTDWKSNANKRRVRSIAGQTLIQIFEVYDDRAIAAHLVNILRSRGIVVEYKDEEHKVKFEHNGEILEKTVVIKVPVFRDPYYMKDDEFLKIAETYREDLDLIALESAKQTNDGIEG